MRRIYITFGGSVYDTVTKKIVTDGPRLGADEVWVYDDVWLTTQDFYIQNKWLWDHPHKRGFGWYAWKPFIILDAFSRLEDGDIVMFTDADTYPIQDFGMLYDAADKDGVVLFEDNGQRHIQWCKRDCYIVMGQDEKRYYDTTHAVARFMLFKKGPWRPYQFLMEWLAYCVNPLCNTFDQSVLGPELPGFVEHRCEQAIMTNLAHKYGYRLRRPPDESGESSSEDRRLYGQLFSQRNPWNDKNKKNITAPVQGSIYMNIPERDARTASDDPRTDAPRKGPGKNVSRRMLALWNISKIKASKKARTMAFRYAPRAVKDLVKKSLEKRSPKEK